MLVWVCEWLGVWVRGCVGVGLGCGCVGGCVGVGVCGGVEVWCRAVEVG